MVWLVFGVSRRHDVYFAPCCKWLRLSRWPLPGRAVTITTWASVVYLVLFSLLATALAWYGLHTLLLVVLHDYLGLFKKKI